MGYQENCLPAEQRQLGHDVRILTTTRLRSDYDGSDKRFAPGRYEYKDVPTYRLQTWGRFAGTGDVLIRGLHEQLDSFNPDVIHSHAVTSPHSFQAARYCRRNDVDLFVDDHTDDGNVALNSLPTRVLFETYRRIFFPRIRAEAEMFLPIHVFSADFLSNRLGVTDSEMQTLPLGVDTDVFHPDSKAGEEVRASLDIPETSLFIVTSGHLVPNKRIEMVIDAIAHLRNAGHEVSLALVGKGEEQYVKSLQERTDEHGLAEYVTFVGFVEREELARYYNAADVGVWPGIGISINEAMGTGLPIVIGNNRATEHLVRGDNGFIFQQDDVQSLTDKLRQYLESPELIEHHSRSTLEYVNKSLSWKAIAERSIDIYSQSYGP